MMLNQKIISKHIIRPSIPTPIRFETHKLSYLDQISVPTYVCPIFLYSNDESIPNLEKIRLLKESLSQTLTVYHPFSGVIKENSFVDCNDIGVEFVEADVHIQLTQLIQEPKIMELEQLLPVKILSHNDNDILLVKVSLFDCGGIAVGVCLSHKVVDYASAIMFMNAWASICRGETQITRPLFDMAIHFPPRDPAPSFDYVQVNENYRPKKFVFDKENLRRLQQQFSLGEVKDPTKVEALTSFLCQQFLEANEVVSGKQKASFLVYHAMNLRSRTIPPIPDQTIGNCIGIFSAFIPDTTNKIDLISKLRTAKNSLNHNYIQEAIINSDEYLRMINELGEVCKLDTKYLSFSSVWRYPVYDVNFGWGKPIWVGNLGTAAKNTILFSSTSSRDGIEAWINMSEDVLQIFEINYNKLFN